MRGGFRADEHGAEFEAHEPAAHETHPFLLEQNRAAGEHRDQHGNECRHRQNQRQHQQNKSHVQHPLPARDLDVARPLIELTYVCVNTHNYLNSPSFSLRVPINNFHVPAAASVTFLLPLLHGSRCKQSSALVGFGPSSQKPKPTFFSATVFGEPAFRSNLNLKPHYPPGPARPTSAPNPPKNSVPKPPNRDPPPPAWAVPTCPGEPEPAFCAGITRKTNARIPAKTPSAMVTSSAGASRLSTVIGLAGHKTFLQFFNARVRDMGNFLAETNQPADAASVLDVIHLLLQHASDENVAGKQRFDHAHDAPLGRPFNPQPRMKHLQIEVLSQICRRDMLMLAFCADAIPGRISGLRF